MDFSSQAKEFKPSKAAAVVSNTVEDVVETGQQAVKDVVNAGEQAVSAGTSMWQTVVDGAAEALEKGVDYVADVAPKVTEAVGDMRSPLDVVTESLSSAGESLSNIGTSEFRFFTGNYFKPGQTATEKDLNETDIETLKAAVRKAMAEGRSQVDYKDFSEGEGTVLKGGPLAGLFNPELRMARTLGGFKFSKDDQGNTIIRNTYNFNEGKKRKAYVKAIQAGDDDAANDILLNSLENPVEAASILAYAKQQKLKDEGKPFETEMVINLGKV